MNKIMLFANLYYVNKHVGEKYLIFWRWDQTENTFWDLATFTYLTGEVKTWHGFILMFHIQICIKGSENRKKHPEYYFWALNNSYRFWADLLHKWSS